MMIKYIKIDDIRLHLKNLVLDGERLDPKTTRLIIMTLRELPIHEVEEESMKEGVEKTQFVDANKKGDCISRQQVMDEIKRWRGYLDEDMIERINTRMNMLPPVTPTVSEDCISRAEALDEFKKDYDDVFDLMTAIEELPSVTPTERTGWIPVSEKLPEKNGDYIVSLEDSIYPWGRFFNGKWYMLPRGGVAVEFGANEVIAWTPLPKPYKGGDTE